MRLSLAPRTALLLYVAYLVLVFSLWIAFRVDYVQLSREENLPKGVIIPIGLGALLIAVVTTLSGAWRPAVRETPVRQPLLLGLLALVMGGCMVMFATRTDWSSLAPSLLLKLGVGMALVGFSEEMLTRGFMVAAFRTRFPSERRVWLVATTLFALLHAPNGFFGVGWPVLVQVVLAFLMGSGLYSLRRLTGTLVVPMIVHAAWDYLTFTMAASNLHPDPIQMGAMLLAYLVSVFVGWKLSGVKA